MPSTGDILKAACSKPMRLPFIALVATAISGLIAAAGYGSSFNLTINTHHWSFNTTPIGMIVVLVLAVVVMKKSAAVVTSNSRASEPNGG